MNRILQLLTRNKGVSTQRGARRFHVPASDIRTVGVVGGGQIGANWAVDFLKSGAEVKLIDADASKEELVRLHIEEQRDLLQQRHKPWGSLSFGTSVEHLEGAQLVTECVPEVVGLKQRVIAELDQALDTTIPIFSSCSGTFSMEELTQDCTRAPERILVAHPFHPVHLCPLVSIVPGAQTDPRWAPWAVHFFRGVGKYAMETQDNVGYVANRLQEALWREALHMLDKGMATPEQIDAAVMHGFGLRYSVQGPLMTYHLSAADGMEGFLRHFGVTQDSPYSHLAAPEFTPELKKTLIDGCERMAAGRSVAELSVVRDKGLAAVNKTLEEVTRVGKLP